MTLADLDTPALCLDLDVAERNIALYQDYCTQHGLALRPHVKTHKLPLLADLQLTHGAIGITCQKISEAEAMLDGMQHRDVDLLISYNILGAQKLRRLRQLAGRCRLSVVADSAAVVTGLAGAFADAPRPLGVFVECNTGADRCGVETPDQALALADRIRAAKGLRFAGLMTYPPAGRGAEVRGWFARARALFAAQSLPIPVISSGGSPDMWQAHQMDLAQEYRVGTYVFNDRSLVARGTCGWADCAVTVLATVVSMPCPQRAVIDAGSKVLTSDLLGLDGYGHVLGHPEITIESLSEEHGRLISPRPLSLQIGDQLRIVPNHVCTCVNMLDDITLLRGARVQGTAQIAARGKVR